MPNSLLDTLGDIVGRQRVSEMAARLGEPEESVRRGVETGSTAILSQVATRAREGGFMQRIFDLVQSPAAQTVETATPDVTPGAGGGLGSRLLGLAFGGNPSSVSEAIARTTGLRPSAAANVLEYAAAPAVLGALSSRVREGGLSMTGLQSMLTGEGPSIGSMLPAGIRNIMSGPSAAVEHAAHAAHTAGRSASRWLVPALLLLLLAMALMWLFGRRRAEHVASRDVPSAARDVGSAARETTSDVTRRLGAFFDHRLPNGVTLRIPQNGVENRLVAYIQDPSQPVSREVWFDFDRLLFDTNSATLQPESQEQLRNISEIMKAYPNVSMKIGGYTDNVGNPEENMRLSQARANNVRNELIGMGVDPGRLVAEGYGDQHPVADNNTEEGRARNRRISMRLTQK